MPLGEVLETLPGADPSGALRRFVPLALARRALETERRQLRQLLTRRADEAGTSAHLAGQRLHALAHEAGYRRRADLHDGQPARHRARRDTGRSGRFLHQ
ncbi:MAG: hypothetical protein WKG07_42175 [Hymenobacter sp.]